MFRHPMEQKTITILKPDGTTSERPMNRANDLNEAIPADDERGVLDRSASVADDDACAFEDGYRRRLREDCRGCNRLLRCSYLGTAFANNSTVEKLADPAIPCPPPGASEASPTSSTMLRSGFFTSSMTTTLCGSSVYHFI